MAGDITSRRNLANREINVVHRNLVSLFRLNVKSLIDQSCFSNISDDCEEFVNFCAVFEEILHHRIKPGRTWYGEIRRQHFWDYIHAACQGVPHSCISNIAAIENIKSAEAKGRAFIRCALMEKRLSEYMTAALRQTKLTKKFYQEGAIMLSDDANMMCGVLLGLNAIDFSFCLKGSNLELVGPLVIDFTPYLKFNPSFASMSSDMEEMRELSSSSISSSIMIEDTQAAEETGPTSKLKVVEQKYKAVCEQKGYLEELLRLRENQLEENQQQYHRIRNQLEKAEKDRRNDRREFEIIILELQGQLTTMKSVHYALQQKLLSVQAQKKQPPHLPTPMQDVQMTDFASTTMVYSTLREQQFTDSLRSSDQQSITGSIDTVIPVSQRTKIQQDSRSLLSGSSGQFVSKEDTQSMVPLTGSISSDSEFRTADSASRDEILQHQDVATTQSPVHESETTSIAEVVPEISKLEDRREMPVSSSDPLEISGTQSVVSAVHTPGQNEIGEQSEDIEKKGVQTEHMSTSKPAAAEKTEGEEASLETAGAVPSSLDVQSQHDKRSSMISDSNSDESKEPWEVVVDSDRDEDKPTDSCQGVGQSSELLDKGLLTGTDGGESEPARHSDENLSDGRDTEKTAEVRMEEINLDESTEPEALSDSSRDTGNSSYDMVHELTDDNNAVLETSTEGHAELLQSAQEETG